MLAKEQELRRNVVEILCLEDLVPPEHLLRQMDSAVDFAHLYDLVDALYSHDNGRPSIDPVVLFKIVLIQHLYGIPSLRRTMQEIGMNIAYRWFLGYTLNDEMPHFSTVSYNFKHRFTEETVERVFQWILYEANRAGYTMNSTEKSRLTMTKRRRRRKKLRALQPIRTAGYSTKANTKNVFYMRRTPPAMRKLHKNIYTTCVAGLYRTGGGCTAYARVPGAV